MSAVEVHDLEKSYAGKPAVRDLSFTVETGEILGVIGPNGAGKSSTIRMILDFIRPDSGRISVLGGPMQEAVKNRIGYLPEEKGLYRNMTVQGVIRYLASLKGVAPEVAERRAAEMLERAGLQESAQKKIRELSKGMGQMVQLIVTVIHDPELIILDEPFSGLDPVNAERMKDLIRELRGGGRAVVLSTHQMNQVEELCDRVLMINQGRAVLYGDLKETTARFRRRSVLVDAVQEVKDLPGVAEYKPGRDAVELVPAPEVTPMMILDRLRERGIEINRFEIATPTLHEIFLKVVEESA